MAVQNRRGPYDDFDPNKMLPGEWACVTNGDPGASDGKSVYMCFEAGKVKRMATYDDMKDSINEAAGDIIGELTEEVNVATETANKAAETANTASQTANTAAQSANAAVQTANSAAQKANEAAKRAEQAASGVTGNYYGAYDSFPRPGVPERLYIDNTVTPSVIYTWDEEKQDYIRTSGKEGFLEESGSGTTILLEDQKSPKSFRSLKVYGKSTQDGTPSPENPVPIVSDGDEGEINVTVSDGGTQSQTLTAQTPGGLPGIPVSSGGNYTDETGQQWIADVKDYGTGKYTQNVQKVVFDGSEDEDWVVGDTSIGKRYSLKLQDEVKVSDTTSGATSMNSNLPLGRKGGTYTLPNIYTIAESSQLIVSLNGTETLSEFKQYLQQNPMTLLYQLSTPIVTDISAEEMEAYKALKTYTPTTVISSDSGVWMEADLVDSDILYPHAENTSYDNSTSGLTSDNVQAAIDENAEAISALNSSYGVNENGSYLRLPDGTQICWLNISVTDQAISDPYSDILYTGSRTWTFPMPFISSPVVSCGIFKWGSSASWGSLASRSSISTVTLRGYDITPREAGTTCLIQAIAIGRWKS